MILTIIDKLNEWVEPFHSWIDANHNNPLMWIGFFLIGLAVFFLTYSALNRNESERIWKSIH